MEGMGRGGQMKDQEFKAAMIDLDKDGSGSVDFEEFTIWWQTQDVEAQNQLMALNALDFSFLDHGGDEV
jgi:Ca2+-binding EF-hand superfamily protein